MIQSIKHFEHLPKRRMRTNGNLFQGM